MGLKDIFKKRELYLVMNHPEGWEFRLKELKILWLIIRDKGV